MTELTNTAIAAFLESLQTTPRGRALAVNMLDSHTAGLYSESDLQDFLLDCVITYETRLAPTRDPTIVAEDVCAGRGHSKRQFLRLHRQPAFSPSDRHRLGHTVKTETFHRFLLDRRYKEATSGLPVVLPAIPVNSPSATLDYKKRLAEVTSEPEWHAPTASIGRPLPQPSNCWITTDYFGPDPGAPAYPDSPASQARDELGLVDYREGTCLVRLSFPASSLAGKTCELARPTFSDLGNARFRVRQSSPRATEYAAAGWGATIHLGKFGDRSFSDATGASERVSSSLLLAELKGLVVECLGRVERDRGITPEKDDDEAFAAALEDGRTAREIRNALLSLLK